MRFPRDFLWGAATSSYQVEGASREDGRGECIWDRFSRTPGKVHNDDNGDVACDHYHRYPEDVRLMKSLGLHAYRFSVSWSRVMPSGTGPVNEAGLDFYDRLVDELLSAGIEPFVTLYHWDLPQALQDRGGWANPESVEWFRGYTALMAKRLGDRVKNWVTHNEPWVIAFVGNWEGRHAPGLRDLSTACRVAHHLLLSHGAAVPVIREHVVDARVGIVTDQVCIRPATESEADRQAAELREGFQRRWILDPVLKGRYPADVVNAFGDVVDGIDLDAVRAAQVPLDYLGINYYTRYLIAADGARETFPPRVVPAADVPVTALGWEVYPEGLYDVLVGLNEEYDLPATYVTENGAAFDDPEPTDDLVEDSQRTAYLEQHFAAAAQAITAGVPLKGYFVWSLLDNFEWNYGYDKRFGIVHVDFKTLERTPKRSAYYLRDLIASTS